jgi:hypothetical protein
MYMLRKFRMRAISVLAVLCLLMPLLSFQTSAVTLDGSEVYSEIGALVEAELLAAGENGIVYVDGIINSGGPITITYNNTNQTIVWRVNAPDNQLTLNYGAQNSANFQITDFGELNSITLNEIMGNVTIDGNAEVNNLYSYYGGPNIIIAGNGHLVDFFDMDGFEGTITLRDNARANILNTEGNPAFNDTRGQLNNIVIEESDPEPASEPTPDPEEDDLFTVEDTQPGAPVGGYGGEITVNIKSDEYFEKDGLTYRGIVDIENFFTDTPQEIPKEVFIRGYRYLVGDTIYIVAEKDLEIVGLTETGISYVFAAVENTASPAKFTAEGLPEGVVLSEDGVLTTETLPLTAGTVNFTVTVDNGLDTHKIEVSLVLKDGYPSDSELFDDIRKHDKEPEPEVMDNADGAEESEEDGGILNLWINGELKLHYDPEMEDFAALFLDGKELIKDEDYLVEDGSTIIILTEKTVVPLKNGDHVVTTLFDQNTEIGMDTVINDVGSSSFVFRMGDKDSDGKRVNIGGDGVSGSVTFEGGEKEEPLTTISANTEAIEKRVNNLSNASGKEIIAAFETKQQGGFGGKTAIFAISAKSLNLSLKNGTAVYVAVYDAKTGKTYQNKGEIKDGMIIFRTKHSGVFMISLTKF